MKNVVHRLHRLTQIKKKGRVAVGASPRVRPIRVLYIPSFLLISVISVISGQNFCLAGESNEIHI